MTTTHRFTPFFKTVSHADRMTTQDIQDEPMLFSATIRHVLDNFDKYPVTFHVLNKILMLDDFKDLIVDQAMQGYHPVIDTKSVLLMPGMYPCIGGWHCDGVIRADQNSQPNLDTLHEPIQHFICSISDAGDGHCGTDILSRAVMLPIEEDKNIWAQVNQLVEDLEDKRVHTTKSGEIVQFDRQTLHRGTPAKVRQWRYFFRLSFHHMPAMNQERKQVQVYTDISQGW